MNLTYVDHIAIESNDIANSVDGTKIIFDAKSNTKIVHGLYLVLKHTNCVSYAWATSSPLCVVDKSVANRLNKKTHRDGIHYIYEEDPDSNVIEKIDRGTS